MAKCNVSFKTIMFEVYVISIQAMIAMMLAINSKRLKLSLAAFALGAYTPGVFLLKIVDIPISIIISLLCCLLLTRTYPKNLTIYFMVLTIQIFVTSILNYESLTGLLFHIYYFLLVMTGVLIANYIHNLSKRDFRSFIKIFSLIVGSGVLSVFIFRLAETTIRDVGFISQILLLCLMAGKAYRVQNILAVIFYTAYSLTRSFAVVIILALALNTRYVLYKIFIYVLGIASLSVLFWFRSNSSGDNIGGLLFANTRFLGILTEWDDFLQAPFFGNGVYYFRLDFLYLLEKVRKLEDVEYIAYNHNLITSLLSQMGSLGLIIFLIFPVFVLILSGKKNRRDYYSQFVLFTCLMSFVSGSIIRLDYDIIIYFYCVSLIILNFRREDKYDDRLRDTHHMSKRTGQHL